MTYQNSTFFFSMPLYKKAMDILVLSRSISTYLNDDLCALDFAGREDENIYFTGDIVQQSTCLAPEIMNAEMERFSDKKHKHIESLNKLTHGLFKNCKRLEHTKSNGRDFIKILRQELKLFKHLQQNWLLTL